MNSFFDNIEFAAVGRAVRGDARYDQRARDSEDRERKFADELNGKQREAEATEPPAAAAAPLQPQAVMPHPGGHPSIAAPPRDASASTPAAPAAPTAAATPAPAASSAASSPAPTSTPAAKASPPPAQTSHTPAAKASPAPAQTSHAPAAPAPAAAPAQQGMMPVPGQVAYNPAQLASIYGDPRMAAMMTSQGNVTYGGEYQRAVAERQAQAMLPTIMMQQQKASLDSTEKDKDY